MRFDNRHVTLEHHLRGGQVSAEEPLSLIVALAWSAGHLETIGPHRNLRFVVHVWTPLYRNE